MIDDMLRFSISFAGLCKFLAMYAMCHFLQVSGLLGFKCAFKKSDITNDKVLIG